MADSAYFLNTRFDRMPLDEAVAALQERALARHGGKVYYANAHTMVTAAKTPAFGEALRSCDYLLADGSGVRWGSALKRSPLIYNLNGTDLVPALCKASAPMGLSVYLLGGKPGVAEDAAANLAKTCPGLIIAGTQHGYFSADETGAVLENIRAARPHLLLVAMGVPMQELWIHAYADQLPGIMSMGVGGLFDFLALRVPRAPRIFRATGMEWTWRMAQEPSRLWRRYLIGNLVFMRLVLTHRAAPVAPSMPVVVAPADGGFTPTLSLVYSNPAPADAAHDYEYTEAQSA